MKTIILCGGLGTRFSEETDLIPKPMIQIDNRPIIQHIMMIYSKYGYKHFLLSAGYKAEKIKEYFINLENDLSKNVKIDFKQKSNQISKKKSDLDWVVEIIDTGIKTQTGARIKKLKKFLVNEENFFMTYGDGVANVNIKKLLNNHIKSKKVATMTIVRPKPRFGNLELGKNNTVKNFKEKNQLSEGWINGGFFVLNKKIFDYIDNNNLNIFEKDPLEKLCNDKQLNAFKHEGFWQPMDTLRDKRELESYNKLKLKPWLK